MRVRLVRARNEGRAPARAGDGMRDRAASRDVRIGRQVACRRDDDDGSRGRPPAAQVPERDQRAPVEGHGRLAGVVPAEAHAHGGEPVFTELLERQERELPVHRHVQGDARGLLERARQAARDDDGEVSLDVDAVRGEHDDDLGVGGIQPAGELAHPGLRRPSEVGRTGRTRLGDGEVAVRGDAGEDEAGVGSDGRRVVGSHGATLPPAGDIAGSAVPCAAMGIEIRHVAVMGLMGAGKTTVGSAVAERLGWSFRDSDADIEASTGRTVRELGAEVGVPAMHDLEARQLLDALDDPVPSVVSAAASTIDVEACRRRLTGADVVVLWLRAEPATLAARFGSSPHRPWYGSDPATFLAEEATRRDPLFESVHPAVVDVDGLEKADVVAAALQALERAGLRVPAPGSAGMPDRPGALGRMDLQPHDDRV